MLNVLVLGATGPVGRALATQLTQANHRVTCLVRSVKTAQALGLGACTECLIEGDLSDAVSVNTALAGIDCVFFAAGAGERWAPNADFFYRQNVLTVQNVVEGMAKRGVKQLVYLSTIEVFERTPGKLYDEHSPYLHESQSDYVRSKLEADKILDAAVSRGDLDLIRLHPAAIYSADTTRENWFVDTVRMIAERKLGRVPPGGMSYVHADDLATAAVNAMQRKIWNQSFILSESYQTFEAIAQSIAIQMNQERAPKPLPIALATSIAWFGEKKSRLTGKPPLIHRPYLNYWLSQDRPNANKAKAVLNWTPRPFEEGLIETLRVVMGNVVYSPVFIETVLRHPSNLHR